MMDRIEFKHLFEQALEIAAVHIEEIYSVKVPRKFEIEFYGLYRSGDILDIETAIDRMYLGESEFFPIIDVMIMMATASITTARVIVSGHQSVPTFEQTWNEPPGSGPFKQMIFMQFKYSTD